MGQCSLSAIIGLVVLVMIIGRRVAALGPIVRSSFVALHVANVNRVERLAHAGGLNRGAGAARRGRGARVQPVIGGGGATNGVGARLLRPVVSGGLAADRVDADLLSGRATGLDPVVAGGAPDGVAARRGLVKLIRAAQVATHLKVNRVVLPLAADRVGADLWASRAAGLDPVFAGRAADGISAGQVLGRLVKHVALDPLHHAGVFAAGIGLWQSHTAPRHLVELDVVALPAFIGQPAHLAAFHPFREDGVFAAGICHLRADDVAGSLWAAGARLNNLLSPVRGAGANGIARCL